MQVVFLLFIALIALIALHALQRQARQEAADSSSTHQVKPCTNIRKKLTMIDDDVMCCSLLTGILGVITSVVTHTSQIWFRSMDMTVSVWDKLIDWYTSSSSSSSLFCISFLYRWTQDFMWEKSWKSWKNGHHQCSMFNSIQFNSIRLIFNSTNSSHLIQIKGFSKAINTKHNKV